MQTIPDTLDFSTYMRQTDPQVKVRKASTFVDDLLAQFDRSREVRYPTMISTKLRHFIEFRPAEVTVWAGYNGHRKSMLTGQVAVDIAAQRQRVLLASFEMQPARTLGRMVRQTCATDTPSAAQVERFSRWSDGRMWVFDHMGRIAPPECMAVMRYFADELKGQHVFIDSMMMVCASEESLDEQKQFTTDLVRLAQETGLHVHLIAHCRKPQSGDEKPPGKYDLRGSAAISDQAHNVITVWANKAKRQKLEENPHDPATLDQPDALVSVEKQRNGAFEGRVKLYFDERSLRFCDDRVSAVEPYPMEVKA